MERLWVKWVVVSVVLFLSGAGCLQARHTSDDDTEKKLIDRYSALERFGAIQREIRVHKECTRRVHNMARFGAENRRTGRPYKSTLELADKIKEQCEALSYPSDKEVEWFNKNSESLHRELERTLISLGRFQERNQVASERILWDLLQRLSEMEERLEGITLKR